MLPACRNRLSRQHTLQLLWQGEEELPKQVDRESACYQWHDQSRIGVCKTRTSRQQEHGDDRRPSSGIIRAITYMRRCWRTSRKCSGAKAYPAIEATIRVAVGPQCNDKAVPVPGRLRPGKYKLQFSKKIARGNHSGVGVSIWSSLFSDVDAIHSVGITHKMARTVCDRPKTYVPEDASPSPAQFHFASFLPAPETNPFTHNSKLDQRKQEYGEEQQDGQGCGISHPVFRQIRIAKSGTQRLWCYLRDHPGSSKRPGRMLAWPILCSR